MDIQTKDGILLRGVPDGTPDEAIKARIEAIRTGGAAPAPAKPEPATTMQKVQASAPMRVVQGLRDSIDAGAQLLSHAVPESVTNVLDIPGRALRNSNSPLLQTIGESFFADPRAAATDKRITETEDQLQAARVATNGGKDPGFDAARFTGQVLSPTNAAMAARIPAAAMTTVPRMIAVGGGAGGLGGALTTVTDPKDQQNFGGTKAAQIGLGAVTGAVLTPAIGKALEAVAPMVNRVIARMTGPSEIAGARASLETDALLAKAFQEIGIKIEDMPKQQYAQLRQQVNESLKNGVKLDPAAMIRKADFEAAGIQPTLGQITRDPMLWAREQNLRGVAGVGEPLTARLSGQDQALSRIMSDFAAGASENATAGEKVARALRETDEALRRRVSGMYGAARESAGRFEQIPPTKLAEAYTQVVDDFADKVPTAIKQKFDKLVLDPATAKAYPRPLTVDDTDKLLKAINDHVGADKATNTALDRLRTAVKQAIEDAPADDVFAAARAAASQRFKLQEAVPALKAAAEGDVSADTFVRKFILGGDTANVKGLARVLQQTSPEAFKEARAQIGASLQRAAFGENLAGDKALAAERMARALRALGSEKMSAFFTQAEIDSMKRAARVAAYIHSVPSASAPNTSNTGAAIANLALNNIPGVGATAAFVKGLAQPVLNARAVSNSMAANIPQQAAGATPEQIRRAALAAAMAGAVGGQAVAPR